MQSLDWVHNLIKCGSSKNFEVYSSGIYSHREEPVFPDARKVKLSNKLSKQIHPGRLGLGGLCNLIGFSIFQANNMGWWWLKLAQQLTSIWRSAHHQGHHHHNPLPRRTPLLSSSIQTYETISHHLEAEIDILFAYHQHPLPTPQGSPLLSPSGSAYVDDSLLSSFFRGNERHPTHEVHQSTLFWCSTNWPSTFCVTIQSTIFPVRHQPSSFNLAPPPSQQQPAFLSLQQ